MRLGLLCPDLSTNNGWANTSLNLIQALQARGVDCRVVCAGNSPPVPFPVYPLLPAVSPPEANSLLKSLRLLPALRTILRECDIVHATVEPYAPLAASLARERPLFITVHGSYVHLPLLRRFPLAALYRRAFARAHLLCVSHYTAQRARVIVPDAPVSVIHNGIAAHELLQPSAVTVQKQGPTVIALGEVKPRKGTLQLVEAMAQVREQLPAAQCLIIGNPQYGSPYTRRVQQGIAELGLEQHVRLLGFVDVELRRAWLAAADVLALPAINDGLSFEGFGLVLLEAGAAGTAVIGSDNCGLADAVIHGKTGLLVSQANIAQELPAALLQILQDPALAARMGAAGRQHALAQTWDRVAQQVIARYQSALA